MSEERNIAQRIRQITGGKTFDTFAAKVTAVSDATCTVERILDDKEIKNVRLNATIKADDGLVIAPKVGSVVLITNIDGDKCFVSQFSEIEKVTLNVADKVELKVAGKVTLDADTIEINGGGNHGLIMIEELTNKLNALVSDFNAHTHPFIGLPPNSLGTTSVIASPAQPFNKSNYENTKVKH